MEVEVVVGIPEVEEVEVERLTREKEQSDQSIDLADGFFLLLSPCIVSL